MEELYPIWLQLACGICNRVYAYLFSRFHSFKDIYECPDYPFLPLDSKYMHALRDKNLNESYEVYKYCKSLGLHIVPYFDPRYPKCLRDLPTPPAVLYGIGDWRDLDSMPRVAVVGTRHATRNGMRIAEAFAKKLAVGGATVISGLAKGIDTCAHMGALQGDGFTVAVLGTAIDRIYPKENAKAFQTLYKRGLVVSEMYPGYKSSGWDFVNRNRLISGLANAALVVEAGEKSGALITARDALGQGIPLFVVPGGLGEAYAGSNQLLKEGARPATDASDILEELEYLYPLQIHREHFNAAPHLYAYGFRAPVRETAAGKPVENDPEEDGLTFVDPEPAAQTRPAPESPESVREPPRESAVQTIYRLLGDEPQTADEIAQKSGLPISELLAELTILEIHGKVQSAPGNRFMRTK